jgi:hypothetical protein
MARAASARPGSPWAWQAGAPRRVLLIDGEMPTSDLRERLRQVTAAAARPTQRGMFEVLSADRVKRGIGNLGSQQPKWMR